MARLFFLCGALLGGLSVVIGAYGAHSSLFDEGKTLWIDKGVRYQMFHATALLVTSLLIASQKGRAKTAILAGWCFLCGTILFSGSLYFMAFGSSAAGFITPMGGMLFIFGWLFLAMSAPGKN